MLQNLAPHEPYDRGTIGLHWLTALLVVALWSLGQTIDWFPKGSPRTSARSVHITLGALLAVTVVCRIFWRRMAGRHLPAADEGPLRLLSTFTHRALYVLVGATVALGVANAWIRGDALFDLFRIPSFAPDDKSLRESVENLHGLAANGLISLAAFHASAALLHHYLWNDGVLRRMVPFLAKR